ncbi:hypothetical protein, partial [Yoonia sp. R2-816]|uniref:hypothetical protein n=1 Tax=Yoonia sp. R2-816 TaxID=3342638 RepID=UPI00372C3286
SNRQHTFPIDTANPRGFHPERFSNAGHPYGQAETSRHGPHQKIFIKPDLGCSAASALNRYSPHLALRSGVAVGGLSASARLSMPFHYFSNGVFRNSEV